MDNKTKRKLSTLAWCVGNGVTLGAFLYKTDDFVAWQRRKYPLRGDY